MDNSHPLKRTNIILILTIIGIYTSATGFFAMWVLNELEEIKNAPSDQTKSINIHIQCMEKHSHE